jgi:hypothetical protein
MNKAIAYYPDHKADAGDSLTGENSRGLEVV